MNPSTVAWMVATTLVEATSLLLASPESSLVVLGTSDAIQEFREGPKTINTSDAVHPSFLSEVELLQRISKFSQRSKRDATVAALVIAGLNVLGIAVVAIEPITGSRILVLSTLLQLLFTVTGDPKKEIQDIVWNERIKQQRLKLISFRDTMSDIRGQYWTATNVMIPHGRMLTLYDILNTERCLFMHDDNIEASADYFSEFAFIHIAINQALILIFPDERNFQDRLIRNVKKYVAYAKHAYQIETQNNLNLDPRRTRVRLLLNPSIYKWTKQLPVHLRPGVNEQGLIRNGEVVSFQLSKQTSLWMSCWVSGSECRPQKCPGQDNPMDRGSQYQYHWSCRGEVFWIEHIDGMDGFIRSCSKVGIQYSANDKGHWWVSGNCDFWTGCQTHTRTCPGDRASNMLNKVCIWETWTIIAKDKPCGEAIQDRDVVEIRGHQKKPPISNYHASGLFTIFRSNVDHSEYKKDLACFQ